MQMIELLFIDKNKNIRSKGVFSKIELFEFYFH